jgi:hypothetical protein
MSLIDEALKRARQEAALQDAARRDAQFRHVPVYVPEPRRSRRALIGAVAGTCAGILLSIAAAWFAGWIPGRAGAGDAADVATPAEVMASAPAPAEERIEVIEAPRQPSPPSEVATAEPQTPSPMATEEPPAAASATAPIEPAPEPAPEPVIEAAPPAVPGPEPAPAATEPVSAVPEPAPTPAEAPRQEAPQAFVREAPVPGGGTVRLNGIAYSSERPVALLNGRPVMPGESVAGFTVVAIEPKRVELRGHGQTVYVSLD